MKIRSILFNSVGKHLRLSLIVLFTILFLGHDLFAQNRIRPTSISNHSHVDNENQAIDNNSESFARLNADAGALLPLRLPHDGSLTIEFDHNVPANTTTFIRLEESRGILDGLLGGALGDILNNILGVALTGSPQFKVDVISSTGSVLDTRSSSQFFNTDKFRLLTGSDNHYYLAVTPNATYKSLTITNNITRVVGLGVAEYTTDIYDVFYLDGTQGCGAVVGTSFDVTGISLDLLDLSDATGAPTTNLGNAIDGDPATYSTIKPGLLALGASSNQYFYFENDGNASDELKITISTSKSLANLDLLNNLVVRTYNGANLVSTTPLSDELLNLDLLGLFEVGSEVPFVIQPGAPFDRAVISLAVVAGLDLTSDWRIHEVRRTAGKPTLTGVDANNTVFICSGNSITLSATPQENGQIIEWYNAPYGGSPIHEGTNYSPGSLNMKTTYYVAAKSASCPEGSERVPVTVDFINDPVIHLNGSALYTVEIGESVTLPNVTAVSSGGGSVTGSWAGLNGAPMSGTNETGTFTTPGIYTYRYSATSAQCTNFVDVTITVLDPDGCNFAYNRIFANDASTYTVSSLLGSLLEGSVGNPNYAGDGDLGTYSVLMDPVNVLGGILSGQTSQTLKWNQNIAAGTPVTIKLGKEFGSVAGVANGISVQALNGNVPVGPVISVDNTLAEALSGLNEFDFTFIPVDGGGIPQQYNAVRVTLETGVLTASNVARVYGAYYHQLTTHLSDCGDGAFDVQSGFEPIITGINAATLLTAVTAPGDAVDGNSETYATIHNVVGANVRSKLDITFKQPALVGDSVYLKVGIPTGLLDLNLLGNFTIYRYLGNQEVDQMTMNSALLQLRLLGGEQIGEVTFINDKPFDRIKILTGGVADALDALRVYEVQTIAKVTIPDLVFDPGAGKYFMELCAGGGLPVPDNDCDQYKLFDRASGGNEITAADIAALEPGDVLTVYAQAYRFGCLSGDYRQEFEIRITEVPVPVLSPTGDVWVQNGDVVTLTVTNAASYAAGTTFEWYKDGTLIPGISGANYTISPVNVATHLGAYTVIAVEECKSAASLPTHLILYDVVGWKSFEVSTGNPHVSGGEEITYTIHVRNNSTQDVEGLIVTDAIPAHTTYVASSASNGGTLTSGVLTWNDLDIAVGETITVSFKVKANDDLNGVSAIENIAHVKRNPSDPGNETFPPTNNDTPTDPDTGGDPGTDIPVVIVNDFAVEKEADQNSVVAGKSTSFTITLTHIGPSHLVSGSSIKLLERPGSGVTIERFELISGAGNLTGNNTNATITTTNDLAPGVQFVVRVHALVDPSASNHISNGISVWPPGVPETDPPLTDDTDPIPVDRITDLAIEKTVNNTSPIVGTNITFVLTVTNMGPSQATGVVVTDQLPDGFEYVSSTASVGSFSPSTHEWSIGELEPNASVTLSIEVKVKSTGDYINTASVTGTEDDPDLSNNTDTPDDLVIPVDNSSSNMTVVKNNALADGNDYNEVSVLILDAGGSPAQNVPVNFTYTPIGATSPESSTVQTGSDGRANLSVSSDLPGQITIAATSPDITIQGSPRTVNFVTGAVDHDLSTLVVIKDGAFADGVDQNILEATIISVSGHPLSNVPVLFSIAHVDLTTSTRTITTDANGKAILNLSSTKAGSATIGASVGGTSISGSPQTVTFVVGVVDHSLSRLEITKNHAVADGVDQNILTATIVDGTNNPIEGVDVEFTYIDIEGQSQVVIKTTNSQGQAVLTLTSITIGQVSVSASVDGVGISGSPKTVTFVAGPVDYEKSTLIITKNNAHADGVDENRLLATIVDGFGNPISGVEVEFPITHVNIANSMDLVLTNSAGQAPMALVSTMPGDAIVAAQVAGLPISGSPQTVTFVLAPDLTISKKADQPRVVAGESTSFTITLSNNSTVAIPAGKSLILKERPGEGVEITGFNVISGSVDITVDGNDALLTTTAPLPSGGQIIVRVNANVLESASGTITNGISVWGPETPPEGDPDDEDDTPEIPVDKIADLSIEKTVNNNQPFVGQQIKFTIQVTNLGPSDATGVWVEDKLPDGYTFVSSEASKGSYNAENDRWQINSLEVGAVETLTITARVLAEGNYTNIATVRGDDEDLDLSNNTDSPDDPVVPQPIKGLSATKVASKDSVGAGDPIEFTITIKNEGPNKVSSGEVIQVEELPSTGLLISGYSVVSGPVELSNVGNRVSLTTTDTLEVGETIILNVSATVAQDAPDFISNRVKVWGPDKNPDEDDPDTDVTTPEIPVNNDSKIGVSKVSDQAVVISGGMASFTITLTNNGPGILKAGEVIEVLERPGVGVIITDYEMVTSNGTVIGINDHATVTATEDLGKGESIQIRVIATVQAASGSSITNGVSVWGPDSPPEDDPDDEDDTPEIPVGDPYTLSISKVADQNRVLAGEETTFTITISNNGPEVAPAGNRFAIRELPGVGLTILSYEVISGPATIQGTVNTANVTTTADLPLGGQIKISIRAKVDERASGTITNKIQVWGDAKNPDVDDPDAEDEIPPVEIDSELLIPNLFTPNGDGLNDHFVIKGLLQYDQAELLIINRWGNRVYHAKPYQNNWDGGSLADGTYFYILTLTKGGETTVHRGPVAIVRKTGRN